MGTINRISKEEMFMRMAEVASTRSTCFRNHVGCVITDYQGMSVVAIGYNGNAKGLTDGCDTNTPGDCGCIHAEVNALIKAPFHKGPLVLYTTISPCPDCTKLLLNSRVIQVFYREEYRKTEHLKMLQVGGIRVEKLKNPNDSAQLAL